MKKKSKLAIAYAKYQKKRITKNYLLRRFLANMPEMIFRTSKLEGEPVNRQMVRAMFK